MTGERSLGSRGTSWESGRPEGNCVGMHLPHPTVGMVVHDNVAELRELEDRICRAGLFVFPREILG